MNTYLQDHRIGAQRIFSLAAALLLGLAGGAYALDANTLPTGGTITAGIGTISQAGGQMTIDQASQRMIANWATFNVGQDAAVRFNQPGSSSVALNRIGGENPSQILGAFSANGQVYLLNPAGIIFGKTAQVDVGGLVASSLDLSDENFLAGKNLFTATGTAGAVLNQGSIRTVDGGYVAFLAPHVGNAGSIEAPNGTVALAAGNRVSLDFTGDRLVTFTVEQGAVDALAENHGLIKADGGLVMMTAAAADQLTNAVVNNDGVIQAQTLENREGRILLLADMGGGTTTVSGTLDASAPNGGDGGFIETSAAQVKVTDDAHITTLAATGETGTWLIDPTNYAIMTGGDISPATLASALTAGNVVIQTADAGTQMGHIYIWEPITWSSANDLTLNAHGDITSYASITNNAGGSLTLRADLDGNGSGSLYFGGGASISLTGGGRADLYYNPTSYAAPTNFSSVMGSTPYTAWMLVNDVVDLQAMNTNLGGAYALGRDIDASATATWNAGAGFAPVGNSVSYFTGQLDGLGHTINGLTIYRPTESQVGLFGIIPNNGTTVVRNVGLLNGSVTGNNSTGGLCGYFGGKSIIDSYFTGTVTGLNSTTGGLVGNVSSGPLISGSYATGMVNGQTYAGGLIGYNSGQVSNSFAAGVVNGSVAVGGLAGANSGAINNTYATGNVSESSDYTGGLVGLNMGSIDSTYATGAISGQNYVGGLVGYNAGTVTDAYASGLVTLNPGGSYAGGLIGMNGSQIYSSYWDTQTTGQAIAIGRNDGSSTATGLTTAQMKSMSSYSGWDIVDAGGTSATWRIYEGNTSPLLRNFLTPLTVTATDATKTYDGLAYSSSTGYTTSLSDADANKILGSVGSTGITPGTYTFSAAGLYSTQLGYDITAVDGTLSVDPAALTVTASNDAKTYDGLAYSGGNGVVYGGFVTGEDATVLGGALSYGGTSQGAVDTGSYTITPGGLTSGNYTISYADGTLSVDPASLTVTANNDSKAYNGLAYSGGNGVAYGGFVTGEDATVLGGTLAYSGSSQGAKLPGGYAITPQGLTSGNYSIQFVDGALTIENSMSPIDSVVASLNSPQDAVNGTHREQAGDFDPASPQATMGSGTGSGTLDDLAAWLPVEPPCVGALRDTEYCR